MEFLTARDIDVSLKDRHLQQMLDGSLTALEDSEAMALAAVRDAIHYRYDVEAIFSDGAAYPSVRRWVAVITTYYLCQRLPDRLVPARVVEDYDQTVLLLARVSEGKRTVALPRRDTDAGTDGTQGYGTFRGGFHHRRSH